MKPYIIENILIEEPAESGKGLARVDGMIVFVDGVVPGDIAEIEITKRKKNYLLGRALRILKPSEQRTEAFCMHFGTCGGCQWQNLSYASQLQFKQKQAEDAMLHIGKLAAEQIIPILGCDSQRYYRNKLEFTFSDRAWLEYSDFQNHPEKGKNALGFHVPGRFDRVLDVKECHLQAEPSNAIRVFVKALATRMQLEFFNLRDQRGMLRNLMIRTSSKGELMVLVCFARSEPDVIREFMHAIAQQFPSINSLLYLVNSKRNDTIYDQEIETFSGQPYIHEQMEDLIFRIGPKSFFQTNSAQALRLYQLIREWADLKGNEMVYDLYTGTGSIALFIARHCKTVVGIEQVPTAIEDAKENARLNGISNAVFYAGDMKDCFHTEFLNLHGIPDLLIADPPRSGMHPDVVQNLLTSGSQRILYVSCNPATQARDLQGLKEVYRICRMQAVDLFPHTRHVENVCLLEKR